jgi:hypothetical protein
LAALSSFCSGSSDLLICYSFVAMNAVLNRLVSNEIY